MVKMLIMIVDLTFSGAQIQQPPVLFENFENRQQCEDAKYLLDIEFEYASSVNNGGHYYKFKCVGEEGSGGYTPTPGMPDICWIDPWQAPEACNYYPNQPPPPIASVPPGQEQDGEWPGLHANPTAPGTITRGIAWEMGRANP